MAVRQPDLARGTVQRSGFAHRLEQLEHLGIGARIVVGGDHRKQVEAEGHRFPATYLLVDLGWITMNTPFLCCFAEFSLRSEGKINYVCNNIITRSRRCPAVPNPCATARATSPCRCCASACCRPRRPARSSSPPPPAPRTLVC
ncbi:hypothetical protein CBM2599_A50137 [Cupriavidus taiwanensis]|nr:hypothetical protein CBM2599_A50137 [Cupriavidus taiwanensis]SOY91315.1 hypothetical protein CBM2600_A60137 [Cupriavidus taiwanensis]